MLGHSQVAPRLPSGYSSRRHGLFHGFHRLFRKDVSGTAILEFAIGATVFCLLLFGVMDVSRVVFAKLAVQEALRHAGRYATTGNHIGSSSRVDSIKSIAQQYAPGVDVSALQISSAVGGSGSAGGPGDLVTLTLSQNVALVTPMIAAFFPSGAYSFTVKVTFKNEYFLPSDT